MNNIAKENISVIFTIGMKVQVVTVNDEIGIIEEIDPNDVERPYMIKFRKTPGKWWCSGDELIPIGILAKLLYKIIYIVLMGVVTGYINVLSV